MSDFYDKRCPVCDQAFTQTGTLNRHIQTHSSEGHVKCTQCPGGKLFSRADSLLRHVRNKHPTGPPSAKSVPQPSATRTSVAIAPAVVGGAIAPALSTVTGASGPAFGSLPVYYRTPFEQAGKAFYQPSPTLFQGVPYQAAPTISRDPVSLPTPAPYQSALFTPTHQTAQTQILWVLHPSAATDQCHKIRIPTTPFMTKWAGTATHAHIAYSRNRAEVTVDESVVIAGKLDEYRDLAMNLTTWRAFATDIPAAVVNADICILPALEQDFKQNFGLSTASFKRLLGEIEFACSLGTRNVRLFPAITELLAVGNKGLLLMTLADRNIPTIPTRVLLTNNDVTSILEDALYSAGFVVKRPFSAEGRMVHTSTSNHACSRSQAASIAAGYIASSPTHSALLQPYLSTMQEVGELRTLLCSSRPIATFLTKCAASGKSEVQAVSSVCTSAAVVSHGFERINDPRIRGTQHDVFSQVLYQAQLAVQVLGNIMPTLRYVARVDQAFHANGTGFLVSEVQGLAGSTFFMGWTDDKLEYAIADAVAQWVASGGP
ncbi:hypothetical protein HDU86_003390 [Geranomyces michiganensis]|nr:hypothetical protein HDU86_003390 [Geranomyces michiganensis]